MTATRHCRTAALGGHVEQCDACGHQRIAFNSCRDRHCPKCQSLVRAQWLQDRQAELLPVEYFHVVFTLPQEVAAIAYQNKAVVYDILFRATAETLRTIAVDPKHLGAEIGFIAVLHTWGQAMQHHPHLHCVVPGGGVSPDGQRWVSCKPGFFLPVRVLSALFRRLFLAQLRQAFADKKLHFYKALAALEDPQAFAKYLAPVANADWVVYAKKSFGGPEQVLEYLGRYTHRVAISNNRLLNFADGHVEFKWKDYRQESQPKVMRLDAAEFVRRVQTQDLRDQVRGEWFLRGKSRRPALKRHHARRAGSNTPSRVVRDGERGRRNSPHDQVKLTEGDDAFCRPSPIDPCIAVSGCAGPLRPALRVDRAAVHWCSAGAPDHCAPRQWRQP